MSAKKTLMIHEWLLVIALILCLAVLIRIALLAPANRWPLSNSEISIPKSIIDIKILGAVQQTGHYHFYEGASVEDALNAAILLPDSEVKNIPLNKKLKTGQTLRIKQKKKKH